MRWFKMIYLLILGILIGYLLFHRADFNARPEYGESGLPKNCRALIYENEKDYYIYKKYNNEELLASIFRNCGETGILWEQ